MTRKMKMLGLVLIAVGAISSAAAASAQAAEFQFETDGGFTTVKGTSTVNHKFTFDAGTGTCTGAAFASSLAGPTGFLIVEPTYTGCTVAGLPATVDVNGCRYYFLQDNDTGNGEYDVYTKIGCPTNKEITVTVSLAGVTKCTIHIPEQELGTGVVMTNEFNGNVEEITAHINLKAIKYSQTAGTGVGACATADNTANGTYTGKSTIVGFNVGGRRNKHLDGIAAAKRAGSDPGPPTTLPAAGPVRV